MEARMVANVNASDVVGPRERASETNEMELSKVPVSRPIPRCAVWPILTAAESPMAIVDRAAMIDVAP